jgi:deoxycytidylate deaminase
MSYLRFTNKAIELAEKSDLDKYHHGCVVACGGREIATGYNSTRTRISQENVPSTHAERSALSSLMDKDKCFSNATIYIVRINADKDLRNSKPCTDCLKLIKKLGIKKIVYSVDGGLIVVKTRDIGKTKKSSGYKYAQRKFRPRKCNGQCLK